MFAFVFSSQLYISGIKTLNQSLSQVIWMIKTGNFKVSNWTGWNILIWVQKSCFLQLPILYRFNIIDMYITSFKRSSNRMTIRNNKIEKNVGNAIDNANTKYHMHPSVQNCNPILSTGHRLGLLRPSHSSQCLECALENLPNPKLQKS